MRCEGCPPRMAPSALCRDRVSFPLRESDVNESSRGQGAPHYVAGRQWGLEGQEKMYSQTEAESELELDPASRRMLVPQELHFSLKIHMCKDLCLTFKGENKTQNKHFGGGSSCLIFPF